LNAPNPSAYFDVGQSFSKSPIFGILSTYPPTACGLATFSAALADGLSANGADVSVVRISDGSSTSGARVVGELINGSPASVTAASELLNQSHIAIIQHEYGIYEGRAFYTMELLTCHDLRELAPMPFRKACSHLRDVAASLSLMSKTIAASTSSFASRFFWPLHATTAEVGGRRQNRKRNGTRRWCGWILSEHHLRRAVENRHANDPSDPGSCSGHWGSPDLSGTRNGPEQLEAAGPKRQPVRAAAS
jgi:hypothetical protein